MADTYCGKNCELCEKRRELGCIGCKAGPGNRWNGSCDIAKCCIEKGHAECEGCTFAANCHKLRGRDDAPENRLRAIRAKKSLEEEKRKTAAFFADRFRILFYIIIAGIFTGLLSDEDLLGFAPAIKWFGAAFDLAVSAAYGYILIKISSENERFLPAGICVIAAAAINVPLSLFAGDAAWTLIITLPLAAAALYGEYNEFKGYSEITFGFERALSEKWENLWKWNLGALLLSFGGIILALILPVFGLLVTLAAMIASVGVGIVKIFYIRDTRNTFREYSLRSY